ncbi:MAG: sugar ABC transporter permease [Ruminococcus sp.]|nr:sugar ABC transporter permease [Ruminococcus sp.]MBQ9139295.1 sugar ABC transporter permease [Ruminococcus sp.]
MSKKKDEKRPPRLSYEKRKSLYGYGFISLWLVGTVCFFLVPLLTSFIWSFCDVTIDTGNSSLKWVGLENFEHSLTTDPKYTECLKETLIETLWKTPLIVIFSLFIAVILNQKFKGRALARAVFFLPVIIATGPVYAIISGDISSTGNIGAAQFSTMFSTNMVGELLQFLGIYGLSDNMETMISAISDNIFSIVWASGIQILLFLAALQTIPSSAREAAQLEGATAWEYFWKITFPYVSPFILVNFIFTVIDSFTNPTNPVMKRILALRDDWQFGVISSMAWLYFGIIITAIGIITFAANKMIYYETE